MPTGARRQREHTPRQSASKQGYTRSWGRYSRRRLARFPFCECEDCEGSHTPAHHTDHILPVSGPDDPLFWEPTNHQSLNRICHAKKTAAELNGKAIGKR